MRKGGFVDQVGRKNFAPDIIAALDVAKDYLDSIEVDKTR